jgi:hypothetical protein
LKADCRGYEIGTSEFFAGPARIYRSEDSYHCVILPEKLGIELDAITEFKKTIGIDLLSDSLPYYCIMPEQIFEAIGRLPEPQFIKEVILKDITADEVSAEFEVDSATACIFEPGRIILSSPIKPNELRPILLEHWSNFSGQNES